MGCSISKQCSMPDYSNSKLDEMDNTCPLFTLENQIHKCKVVNIYDGDTIKVVFPVFGTHYRWNCRLAGVDTPEMRTHNDKEKAYATKARDALREKILNKIIEIHCGKFDKYGRLLGDLYFENKHINQWLIDEKYAFPYGGKTKKDWGEYLDELEKSGVRV